MFQTADETCFFIFVSKIIKRIINKHSSNVSRNNRSVTADSDDHKGKNDCQKKQSYLAHNTQNVNLFCTPHNNIVQIWSFTKELYYHLSTDMLEKKQYCLQRKTYL